MVMKMFVLSACLLVLLFVRVFVVCLSSFFECCFPFLSWLSLCFGLFSFVLFTVCLHVRNPVPVL